MTSNQSATAVFLCATLLAGGVALAREETRETRLPASYVEFEASGQATALMAIARRIYRETVGALAESPVEIPVKSERPAGPRDEPPPPEWPEGPTGVVLCLKMKDRVRACEGGRAPASPDLVAAISVLAERLPASGSRGKPRPLSAREQPAATLEAAFILRVEPITASAGKRVLPTGIDGATVGFVVSGAAGEVATLPGELRSIKAALKLARKAGVAGRRGVEPVVGWYAPVAIGSVPIVTP